MTKTNVFRAVAVVFLVLIALPCAAATYTYGFESGTLDGWTVDGTDLAPDWHIIPSRKLPYAGLWSLEYYMANINDATKIWIERSYDVPAGHRYDVNLTWKLASRDSQVSACPIIAYVDNHDLETHFDGIQVIGYSSTSSYPDWTWLSEGYYRTGVAPGTSSVPGQGKIWVAIGMWGTFEVGFTWYLDSVTVDITESAGPVSIGQARQLADGTRVFLQSKTSSTGWSDLKSPDFVIRRLAVEEPLRSAGVIVKHYRTFLGDTTRGLTMDVSGEMATDDGERVVKNATVSWNTGVGATGIEPFNMINSNSAGGPLGSYVPGAFGTVGINNTGLLITSSGRVVSKGTGYFVIDDGSRKYANGKSAINGLAVSTADALLGVTMPPDDSFVSVTGISGLFSSGGSFYPIIRLRAQSDINQFWP